LSGRGRPMIRTGCDVPRQASAGARGVLTVAAPIPVATSRAESRTAVTQSRGRVTRTTRLYSEASSPRLLVAHPRSPHEPITLDTRSDRACYQRAEPIVFCTLMFSIRTCWFHLHVQ